jgi:hypothetical protein
MAPGLQLLEELLGAVGMEVEEPDNLPAPGIQFAGTRHRGAGLELLALEPAPDGAAAQVEFARICRAESPRSFRDGSAQRRRTGSCGTSEDLARQVTDGRTHRSGRWAGPPPPSGQGQQLVEGRR